MPGRLLSISVAIIAVVAVLLETQLKDVIAVLGIGRRTQPLSDFSYSCRRIQDETLQLCRDLWLAETTRTLYTICPAPEKAQDRQDTASPSKAQQDTIVALDLNPSAPDQYNSHHLSTQLHHPSDHPTTPHLHALTGLPRPNGADLFLLATSSKNSTIEHFLHLQTSSSLSHRRTFTSPLLHTPNSLAAVNRPIAVFFTNAASREQNLLSGLFPSLFRSGSIDLCDTSDPGCMTLFSGLSKPTGLVYATEGFGRMYTASSLRGGGGLRVFDKTTQKGWTESDRVAVPYVADALSRDQRGDLWMVGRPSLWRDWWYGESAEGKATVVRVSRDAPGSKRGWSWEKILEDGEGEVLGGMESVVNDAETGRLYLSGRGRGLVVCEKT